MGSISWLGGGGQIVVIDLSVSAESERWPRRHRKWFPRTGKVSTERRAAKAHVRVRPLRHEESSEG